MTKSAVKSMTGYGEASLSSSLGTLYIMLKSTNRKHFEIDFSMPRLFFSFEQELKREITKKISRGQIFCMIKWKEEGGKKIEITPNLPLAQELKKGWEKLASSLGLAPQIPLELLLKENNLFQTEESILEEKELFTLLQQVLTLALQHHLEMRTKEGEALFLDLTDRVDYVKKCMETIASRAKEVQEALSKKAIDSVRKVFTEEREIQERAQKELLFLLDKGDVTEEIVRFKSHLASFLHTLELEESKGKKLDFILQELFREINTLSAKCQDIQIASLAIEIKSALEKMREQVQNIE